MPTSPRACEWFRGPQFGYCVEEDYFLSRITVLVAGVAAGASLVRTAASSGWSSTGALVAGAGCLVIAAATIWSVTRFGRRHLVLGLDSTGITFGPGLWAYLRRREVRDFVAWRQVTQVRLFTLDYACEPQSYSLIRSHLRITTEDGRQIERALPPSVDIVAFGRALREFAPQLLTTDQPSETRTVIDPPTDRRVRRQVSAGRPLRVPHSSS
ncbi:MAG TPA: hypothetical protein VHN80_09095 [Kineosporiaceae bacterium]|nr:hypothetical protein [Kineosporiaceae bacterium]